MNLQRHTAAVNGMFVGHALTSCAAGHSTVQMFFPDERWKKQQTKVAQRMLA